MAKQKVYKVGIYVRLSKEDNRAGESVSIENQKLMLSKYVNEKRWDLVEIYQDDGFSGTNQNRPAFQRMIADVKAKFINTILIKDLSRLGRNYLDVGHLAEVFLPEHSCELISINEKLDDMMVFRNWFNEQHSKTTSIKVKAGKRISAQNGKFVGAYAPYGFKKKPENRHELVIDENAAPIVRRIFDMRADGIGYRAIAAQLNQDGITSPREYYYQSKNIKNPTRSSRLWNENTIKDMVKNEVYIGNMISGKFGSISYKNQRKKRKDSEEWIKVEATHEPLISLDLWKRVHVFIHKNYKPSRRTDNEKNLFVGLLYCNDCGFKLRGQVERRTRKDNSEYKYVSYLCSTYGRSGKDACTIHRISENVLMDLVANHIRTYARIAEYSEEKVIQAILFKQNNAPLSYHGSYQNELDTHKKQIARLDILIENLLNERVAGRAPDSLFVRQTEKYENERQERVKAIGIIEKRLKSIQSFRNDASTWTNLIKQYRNLEILDTKILFLLIDKIIVNEPQHIDGRRVCDVQIIYNYVGNIDKLGLTETIITPHNDNEELSRSEREVV